MLNSAGLLGTIFWGAIVLVAGCWLYVTGSIAGYYFFGGKDKETQKSLYS